MNAHSEKDPWVEFKKNTNSTDDIVERYAAADIAYPTSEEEYCGLGSNAVAMITAISEHIDELPLARAYMLTGDNKEIEVNKLKLSSSDTSFTGNDITKTKFADGKKNIFVNISFWLIPAALLVDGKGVLVLDFKGERKGFTVYRGSGEVNTRIKGYIINQNCGAIKVDEHLNVKIFENFLLREFIEPNRNKENKIYVDM